VKHELKGSVELQGQKFGPTTPRGKQRTSKDFTKLHETFIDFKELQGTSLSFIGIHGTSMA
jgi:hypothetical protein